MTRPALRIPRDPGEPALLVAELSANHGGSLERALETIRAAKESGADAIKIQTYTADTLTIDCERPEFHIETGPWAGSTLHELYERASTPWEWHEELLRAAEDVDLPLFSTPFDASAVAFLEQLGVSAYKIASFELVDHELLAAVARTDKPMLISTGLATREEIGEAVEVVRSQRRGADPGLCLLHCVSAYPAAAERMQLASLRELERFGATTGLSDHSPGHEAACVAVAAGARVIEKHFTLSRAFGGPDAHFSMEPAEFRELAAAVRRVERMLGVPRDGPSDDERENLRFRRSLFLVADVAAGEELTRENVRSIRPGDGLAPKHLGGVLGRRLRVARPRGTPLSLDDLA